MAKKVTTKKEAEKKAPAKSAKAKPVKEAKKTAAKPKAKAVVKAPAKKPAEKKVIIKKGTVKKEDMEKKVKKVESVAPPVKAETPKKAPAVKGYGKKDLEHFRKIILEKRDEILEQLQNLKEQMMDPTTGEYINENSPYSLHMAEQGTDAMEREKTFLYAQRENKFLSYLEDALKRIDLGTYGICIECIEEPQNLCPTCPLIPKARLEAVPHSQLCVQMKQKQEKR
jgi:RNA polymerase-binding transcription factor DksA